MHWKIHAKPGAIALEPIQRCAIVREQSIDAIFPRRIHGSEKFHAAILGSLKSVCIFSVYAVPWACGKF